MRLSLPLVLASALSGTLAAHAGIIQLSSASQLSSSDTTLDYPGTPGTVYTTPPVYTAGGNTLTFFDSDQTFALEQVGVQYGGSGFANGTIILFAAGFRGAEGPVSVSFQQGVTELGFNAEDFAGGNELFSLSLFDGAALLGTITEPGNDPTSLAFLGVDATGGSVITSFTLTDAESDNIALGPITFATPAASGSATPEPGSLALLGTGILGTAAAVRRRRA